MTQVLPSLQADRIRTGLVDYLSTTFALADAEPRQALAEFLQAPEDGIFKGPYVRLRLPFRQAKQSGESPLDWQPPFPPYRHQAEAYRRLTTKDLGPEKPRPHPTLVTTGTGSGKTEAFLNPILDHVLRARRDGVTGMKALILYPMNALADDQAGRLTQLITTDPRLSRVTAGLYTGDARGTGPGRTSVTEDGLITHRDILRDSPPDILLTNYKMLDQLLLRPDDAPIWAASALSLTYLVLDEFHTYDGAQGTDVAMLLRRLGLRLRSLVPDDHPDRALFDERPLGRVTPVATSATLGDGGSSGEMLDFAAQVFGEPFTPDAAITESRVDVEDHSEQARRQVDALGLRPREIRSMLSEEVAELAALGQEHRDDAQNLTHRVALHLYELSELPEGVEAATLLRAHPDVRAMIEQAANAVPLSDLTAARLAGPSNPTAPGATAERAIATVLAALSHLRLGDRDAVSVEVTLWVREVTRLDRVVSSEPGFCWSDDAEEQTDAEGVPALPALYCRYCGRSGWGVALAATGRDLSASDAHIRAEHLRGTGRFRALLHAPGEATLLAEQEAAGQTPSERVANLRWLHMPRRTLIIERPDEDDPDLLEGRVLPVVMHDGDSAEVEAQSKSDTCPSCGKRDQIRFIGSAVATLLSVTLSTLFGDRALDVREKRALVFTDSVQDAAHRAGFVDTRSHTLSLRAALRDALTEPMPIDAWAEETIRRAEPDPFARSRLVPRALLGHESFWPFWGIEQMSKVPKKSRTAAHRRLLFDVGLEVGLQTTYGRTLEATGSIAVQVDAGADQAVLTMARRAWSEDATATLPGTGEVADQDLMRWVHGTLEHLRREGAIDHPWLDRYVKNDGARIWIWGRRRRDQGAPAFPAGRSAPAYAVVGGDIPSGSAFVRVTSPKSWYAQWARKCLNVSAPHGATLAARLLRELAAEETVTETITEKGSRAYGLALSKVVAMPLDEATLRDRTTLLVCTTCRSPMPVTPRLGAVLDDGPCSSVNCRGVMQAVARDAESFYRTLFASSDMRRVNAHEHTSIIEAAERREIEAGFKRTEQAPADPNVLVATPTLEMGIDIGDLSTVMLASLPDSVAKYLQRVGRAGRLTGSALAMSYVTGRGDQLPRLGDPTSLINGAVRPPATYLDAEEILRRQFLAYVIDDLVRAGRADIPPTAGAVLKSAEPGTLLGDVVERVQRQGERLLADFVGTFADQQTTGLKMLREWALGYGESGETLQSTVYRAAVVHQQEREELLRRRAQISDAIPDLRERAELPAATHDDKAAYRSAVGARKLITRVLSDLTDEPWINGLEIRGLLPNYSLIDDRVELDVQVSWVDPDTQQFEHDSLVIDRGSSRALTELAPGTWFYARGLQMAVDGVEIGQDDAEVVYQALCDTCGYIAVLSSATAASPTSCPRCGSVGIADAGQRLAAVQLRRVFSDIRRDDAQISDDDDARRSTRFEVLVAVDFDPDRLVEQWAVEQVGLGVSHYRRLPVRWLNLGRLTGAPTTGRLAGRDTTAQKFRVCEACGKLDRGSGANSVHEHRAWCPHRRAVDEHCREIVLSRELVTQGVAVSLPPSVTADPFGASCLQAALLLGLRETMGGSPDHLRSEIVPHPLDTADGQVREALLLHDVVPGGTGYLTDLASAPRLWAILVRAAAVLESCPCQDEGRACCHRCLLPFSRDTSSVTRNGALRALRLVLGLQDGEDVPDLDADVPRWQVVESAVDPGWGETTLEQDFRAAAAKHWSVFATVKEKTGVQGPELVVSGVEARVWKLRPQVQLQGTRPDFLLTGNGGVETYAIYTDGHAYHATLDNNRLADDARKRARLRAQGIRVISLPYADVHAPSAPPWLDAKRVAALMNSGFGISRASADELRGGALTLLDGVIRDPFSAARVSLANALPFLLAGTPGALRGRVDPSSDLATLACSVLKDPGAVLPSQGDELMIYRMPHLVLATRLHGTKPVEMVLVIDDSDKALMDADHATAWREWLRLSNVLGLADVPAQVVTRSIVLEERGPGQRTPMVDTVLLPEPWAQLDLTGFGEDVAALVAELAEAGAPVPELGEEVGDGVPAELSWSGERVAVLHQEAPDEDVQALRSSGWSVLMLGADPATLAGEVCLSLNADKGK